MPDSGTRNLASLGCPPSESVREEVTLSALVATLNADRRTGWNVTATLFDPYMDEGRNAIENPLVNITLFTGTRRNPRSILARWDPVYGDSVIEALSGTPWDCSGRHPL